jgi:hypothetical protein
MSVENRGAENFKSSEQVQTQAGNKKDCVLCKITGSLGLLGISAYVFYNAAKHTKRSNRVVLNFIGSGIYFN